MIWVHGYFCMQRILDVMGVVWIILMSDILKKCIKETYIFILKNTHFGLSMVGVIAKSTLIATS